VQRKITLSKGTFLWDAGDAARTIAVLEKGRLGVRVGDKLVGLIPPKTILGESALLTLDGGAQSRTAAIEALEDDTHVTEYPTMVFRQVFDAGNHGLAHLILLTLVGQACRNYLLIAAAHRERQVLGTLLQGQVRALGQTAGQIKEIRDFEEFLFTFKYLFHLRDESDAARARLVRHLAGESEAMIKASEMIRDILKGHDAAAYFDEVIAAEREKDKWLETKER
jgi:hypothetical protein